MILHATEAGQGRPVVLLHGLFGSATNFATVQRRLAPQFRVLAFDLRNHGSSPHDPAMTYDLMAADVFETLDARGIERAALIGHSMGGKTAMQAALTRPGRVSSLVVADISPVAYTTHFRGIARALLALELAPGLTRSAANEALAAEVPDPGLRGFLLQNLRFSAGGLAWRIGLPEIAAALPNVEGWAAPDGAVYEGSTLVLRGERSDYVLPEHRPAFRALFPHARFATIRNAGHLLHADAPDAFLNSVATFLARAEAGA